MAVRIDVERPLDAVVHLGVVACDVGRVEERDLALDGPLSEAAAAARSGEVAGIEAARVLDVTAARLAEYAEGRETDRWVS